MIKTSQYEEYLKTDNLDYKKSEMFKNGWIVIQALTFVPPDIYRPYTFDEFVLCCEKNQKFYNRFIKWKY